MIRRVLFAIVSAATDLFLLTAIMIFVFVMVMFVLHMLYGFDRFDFICS